jgi:hypothetical protein
LYVERSFWRGSRGEQREFRSSGVQEFRSSGVQEFRSSGVQEFRSSGVQEFRSSGWAYRLNCNQKGLPETNLKY